MKPRISMITLGTSNLQRAIDFYEKGLGLPRMDSPPNVAFFTLNGTWLGLFGRDSLAVEAGISSRENGYNGFALVHNLNSEEEVDLLFNQVLKAGATVTKKAQKTDWGGYSGYFQDPDGHLWEIAHNPHFWVGPKDD